VARRLALLAFVGGAGTSPLEHLVADGKLTATLRLIDLAGKCGQFADILVVTDVDGFCSVAGEAGAQVVRSSQPFHFGRELLHVLAPHQDCGVVYAGGGSLPFASVEELASLAALLDVECPTVLANNMFSSDVVAFWPASSVCKIPLRSNDNDLAWSLHHDAGLQVVPWPASFDASFDIDTPTDVAVLKFCRRVPDLIQPVTLLAASMSRISAASDVLARSDAQVLVSGRVSLAAAVALQHEAACVTRLIIEERGMRSSGRLARGEAKSLLGEYLKTVGAQLFFGSLADMCQAAFIDSRVLFAHLGLRVSTADRFNSDALLWHDVCDPVVQEFTRAAADSTIPVVLGGHSLVSGGVRLLLDDARRRGIITAARPPAARVGVPTKLWPSSVGGSSNASSGRC
jgi:hypothetical protein